LRHVLHEERSTPSRDWVKGARIEKDAVIPMRIGLTQTNLEKGYDYLMEVYVPPRAGKLCDLKELITLKLHLACATS
jgi:hypothetical protein